MRRKTSPCARGRRRSAVGRDAVGLGAQEVDPGREAGSAVQVDPLAVQPVGRRGVGTGGPVEVEPLGDEQDGQGDAVVARPAGVVHEVEEALRGRERLDRRRDPEASEGAAEVVVLVRGDEPELAGDGQARLRVVGGGHGGAEQGDEPVEEQGVLREVAGEDGVVDGARPELVDEPVAGRGVPGGRRRGAQVSEKLTITSRDVGALLTLNVSVAPRLAPTPTHGAARAARGRPRAARVMLSGRTRRGRDPRRSAFSMLVDRRHLVVGELEVEDREVLADALGVTDFGKMMLPSWMCQRSTTCAADLPCACAMSANSGASSRPLPWPIGLHASVRDAVALVVRAQARLLHVRVQLDLVDRGDRLGLLERGGRGGAAGSSRRRSCASCRRPCACSRPFHVST